jgi:hypothetical protein
MKLVVAMHLSQKNQFDGFCYNDFGDLLKQKSANVSQALQGKVAGVQITNNPDI